jgi:hypothetical protein
MAETKKKISTKVREAAGKIYERSVPESRASLKELMEGDYDKRGLPEKIYDFGGERIVAPMVDMVGAGLEKVGMKKGGMVRSSASKRADGCAQRGKTRGKMV